MCAPCLYFYLLDNHNKYFIKSMNIKFSKEYLDNTVWNLNNSDWQVSGIIKNRSNENLKFIIFKSIIKIKDQERLYRKIKS